MIKLAPAPEIPAACLIAARRAVYAELAVYANNTPGVTWGPGSESPEVYAGGPIVISATNSSIDIGPYIDVAVREAAVQLGAIEKPRRQRWWQGWRRP